MSWRGARLAGLAAAVVAGAVAVPYSVVFARALLLHDEWATPRTALVAGSLLLATLAAAAGVLIRRPLVRIALLSTAVAGLLGWGVLAIFSIGLPLLLAGVLALVALLAALVTAPGRMAVPVWLASTALALGASAVAFAATAPPLVACTRGGASVASPSGRSGRVSSSTTSSSVGGAGGSVVTGTVVQDGTTTHFTCRDGRLVELRRD